MVPNLKSEDLIAHAKVGIRAQLYDKQKNELVMDFLIDKTQNETHVLNAVSPAFTSSFSFAKLITSTSVISQPPIRKVASGVGRAQS